MRRATWRATGSRHTVPSVHVVRIDDLRPPGGGSPRFEGHAHGASVSFFVIDAREGDGPGLHTHPYEETFVILEGSATFTVDGQALEAGAGTVVVVPAGAVHRFTVGRAGMRSVNIHGGDRMVQDDLG
jgi:quercetin dioxygenase-like cupin family protein